MKMTDGLEMAVDEAYEALRRVRAAIRNGDIPAERGRQMMILAFEARGMVDLVSDVLRAEK